MSRTIRQIYEEAIAERNRRLELTEFSNDSKMSVLNGVAWMVAALIYTFESILDVFAVDVSETLESRINGTPRYYADALLNYQKGDRLVVREDGLAFGYASIDPSKRIITQVSYVESTDSQNVDSKLILKVATGERGALHEIEAEELTLITAYINQLKFAGTRIEVISRKGDVLIPRVTVYWDGAVPEAEIYDALDEALYTYVMSIDFDAAIYVNRVWEAIRSVEHVTDVWIDSSGTPAQGIFLASYDGDGNLQPTRRIERMTHTSSGYVRESTGTGAEAELPTFRQSIKLVIDK
ncbi:MAG: hypothetical protein IJC16_06325 [Rikenellaceae bacterium]|nr:hypothetical protein [Rikenellaceae bacterium]